MNYAAYDLDDPPAECPTEGNVEIVGRMLAMFIVRSTAVITIAPLIRISRFRVMGRCWCSKERCCSRDAGVCFMGCFLHLGILPGSHVGDSGARSRSSEVRGRCCQAETDGGDPTRAIRGGVPGRFSWLSICVPEVVTVRAGEVLYLPFAWWHQARRCLRRG